MAAVPARVGPRLGPLPVHGLKFRFEWLRAGSFELLTERGGRERETGTGRDGGTGGRGGTQYNTQCITV